MEHAIEKSCGANPFAQWELRLGRFRVFYNVDEQAFAVIVEAVGFKVGNLLFVRGKRKGL